jgi:hypothetical protein
MSGTVLGRLPSWLALLLSPLPVEDRDGVQEGEVSEAKAEGDRYRLNQHSNDFRGHARYSCSTGCRRSSRFCRIICHGVVAEAISATFRSTPAQGGSANFQWSPRSADRHDWISSRASSPFSRGESSLTNDGSHRDYTANHLLVSQWPKHFADRRRDRWALLVASC